MPYLGNAPSAAFQSVAYQDLTGGTGTSFTLSHAVSSAQEIEVFVNNVRQEPTVAYTVAGTALTMTGTIAATDDFYVVFQGKAVGSVSHPTTSPLAATTGNFTGNVTSSGTVTATSFSGDGSALTGVSGGKVLQVVHSFYDTEESLVLSADTAVATGLTATITPTDATSKILVTYSLCTSANNSGAAYGSYHMVYHDIGQTGTDTAFSSRFFGARFGGNSTYSMSNNGGQIYHDHNTTSAIDYTVYVEHKYATTVYINRGGSNETTIDGVSSITLMEIEQ